LSKSTSHNVLIITYWSFEDALVQTYTLPYVHILKEYLPPGSEITLVTQEPNQEEVDRLNNKSDLGVRLKPMVYTPFGASAIWRLKKMISELARFIKTENISTIHCWCTPAGAIGYFLHKKTKAQLVIDSFEPHAESMVENSTWKANSMAFKILWKLERKQALKASHLIGLTKGMRQYSIDKYGVTPKNYYVKPACIDSSLYGKSNFPSQREMLGMDSVDTVCVYAGKIGGIYMTDEVFLFWKACDEVFENFKVLFLTNYDPADTEVMRIKHGLREDLIIQKFVPHKEIPGLLAQADFALNPVKPVPSKRYCTSIKDGEYWSTGLPIVITPNISEDSEIIESNKIGVIMRDTEYDAMLLYAREIKTLLMNPNISSKIREIAETHRNFKIAHEVYEKIYSRS